MGNKETPEEKVETVEEEKIEETVEYLESFKLLNTTNSSSRLYSEIKHNLEKKGRTITDMDILIASICITNNATLVTSDKNFKQMPDLQVELVG